MTLSALLGWMAGGFGCVMALAPLLQARRILALRSSPEVSAVFLVVIAVGAGMYAAWAASSANWFLFTPNALGVLTNLWTAALALRYRRARPAATLVAEPAATAARA